VLVSDGLSRRLEGDFPSELNLGVRYTLNFPSPKLTTRERFNLETEQLRYLGKNGFSRLRERCTGKTSARAWGFVSRHEKNCRANRIWIGILRSSGHHYAVHESAIPICADGNAATLTTSLRRSVVQWSTVSRGSNPGRRMGQGVFTVDHDLGSGYVQQGNSPCNEKSRRI